MDIKYILPFLESLRSVLGQFGVSDIKRGKMEKEEIMGARRDITAVVGLVGQIRGNIAYSMSEDTGKQIISTMMMGTPIDELDEMGRSGIGEFSNMVMGNASILLETSQVEVDITPPSIIFGKDIFFIISSVETIRIDMETPFGIIEVHIALEI